MELHEAVVGHGPGSRTEDSCEEYDSFQLSSEKQTKPLEMHMKIEGQPESMELDTGAAVSMVSESTYNQLWPTKSPQKSFTRLRTYTEEQISVLGKLDVKMQSGDQMCKSASIGGTG